MTLYERFLEARPVGAGLMLQPTGLSVLDALDLSPAIEALGQPIRHIFGREVGRGRIVLDVRYDDLHRPRRAVGIHRAALFHTLFDAAVAAGVRIETGFEATSASGGRLTDVRGRVSARHDLMIDASGARSRLAAALGARPRPLAWGALWASVPWPGAPFDEAALQQAYRGASLMAGVLPVGVRPGETERLATVFWSLKGEAFPAWRAAGLYAWKDAVRAHWPEAAPLLETLKRPEDLTFAQYGHHRLARPAAPGLAVIGDAAHAASPQLGQGVNMGLLDAHALGAALERHADLEAALSAYVAARRAHVALYQALSAVFTPFYQSDNRVLPWIRDHLLGKVARLPLAPRLLAATVSGLLLDPRLRR